MSTWKMMTEPHRGAEVRLVGHTARALGVSDDDLIGDATSLAEAIGLVLTDPDHAELGPFSPQTEELARHAWNQVRVQHAYCSDGRGNTLCALEDSESCVVDGRWFDVDEVGQSLEILLDFVAAYVQGFDAADRTEWASDVYPEAAAKGEFNNGARRARLIEGINKVLKPAGWVMVDTGEVYPSAGAGTRDMIERPALAALSGPKWEPAARAFRDAEEELANDRPDDALTDIGTGVQHALEAAGYRGKTLKEQVAAARASGLFSNQHFKLGSTLETLLAWISAYRNQASDAHHTASSAHAHVACALRMGLAFAALLADEDLRGTSRHALTGL